MADNKTTVNATVKENAKSDKPPEAANDAAAAEAPPETDADATATEGAEDVAELKSRLLHTLADMENLRRRTEREIADTRKYAVTGFAREMLTVGDNLRRAIDAVPPGLREGGDKAVTALIEGVEVTARSLEQALGKFGVTRIEAKGQKFDPSRHQAMMEVDAEHAEPGSVAEEIQAGFAIGDRVLRPAFVSVVRKRPKAEAEPEAAPTPETKPAPENKPATDDPASGG